MHIEIIFVFIYRICCKFIHLKLENFCVIFQLILEQLLVLVEKRNDQKYFINLCLFYNQVFFISCNYINNHFEKKIYNFSPFNLIGIIYHYDFAEPEKEPTIFREVKLKLDGFNPNDYVVDQVFYPSKDGTKIPMFVIHRKNNDENTKVTRPCLLYGYGGFNYSIQPVFSITGLIFIDTFDGMMAFPNIRGGGEYGEKWHNSGRLLNKQNCFDDFQAAAKYLVAENYTTHKQIVIQGGSNGGLLVGACINQSPNLFGAAVAQVG